jgi:hypothetical protein
MINELQVTYRENEGGFTHYTCTCRGNIGQYRRRKRKREGEERRQSIERRGGKLKRNQVDEMEIDSNISG